MPRRPPSPSVSQQQARSPLTDLLVTLAGTPDDNARLPSYLLTVAQLTADRVPPVTYASVTTRLGHAYTTVAASSDIATAVDQAQYAEGDGPCIEALQVGAPVPVPDVTATMRWPNFCDTAFRLGLRASLSLPLFAARGEPVAALNLYGRDAAAMAALTAAVWAAYDDPDHRPGAVEDGSDELVAGLLGAHSVRDRIQRAIGVLVAEQQETSDQAYLTLQARAAVAGTSLADTATAIIEAPR